jgi:hypothetical protein
MDKNKITERVKELKREFDLGNPEDVGRLDGFMEGFATASNLYGIEDLLFWKYLFDIAWKEKQI